MKTVELICANCKNSFIRKLKEYKRQTKCGRNKFFCGLSCARLKHNEERPPIGNVKNLHPPKLDEYSSFRWYTLRSQYRTKRNKKRDTFDYCDLDPKYLKDIFDIQNGKCPFTGWDLFLPKSTYGFKEKLPQNASLDRIDNSKGYVKGNVRFISLISNYARNVFTDNQLINFCKAVNNTNN